MLINGRIVDGRSESRDVLNPATGEVVGYAVRGTYDDVDQAVRAAKAAFLDWSRLSGKKRAGYLHKLGDLIASDVEAMGRLMTSEQGKPVNEAKGEITKLAEACHFYAEEASRVHGEVVPNDSTDYQSLVVREPIGVVGAIAPWNYPAELIGWKLCGALAAGCTIVIKPAEITPLIALAIGNKTIEAGIPPGVVNIVTGSGSVVGQALAEHPDIDKIAFTGSSAVGLKIQKSCVNIKRLSLELGGNCPLIVTGSANLDAAVKGATRRSFRNCGQICIAINRIYVDRPVYDEFIEQLGKSADALVVENGLENPSADLGAMASSESLTKTREHMDDALSKGARLIAGGDTPKGKAYEKGYFFRPTVLADCNHDMKIMTEETFGPIVGVAPFENLEQAVELANDTPYGLASYVYAKNSDEIQYLSSTLDYGNVGVNNVDAGIMNAPYGGRKQSGVGYEHGKEGMLEYMNFKHVRVHYEHPAGS